jgi:hypothetical protein
MEGLDYLGADPTPVRLPWIVIPRPAAVAGEALVPSLRRTAALRRVTHVAAGAVVGAAYGSMVGSIALCALAGAAVCGVFWPARENESPIPLERIPFRQRWREAANQPDIVALAKIEPEVVPAAAPTPTDAADRFGKLEID